MHLWLQSLRGEALTPVWYPHVSHWSYGSLRRGIWFWPVLNINHSLWFIFNVNVCLLGHKYVLIFDSNHLVQKPLWRFIPMMLKFISSCNSSVLLLGGTVGSSSALQLSCHPCWKAYSWSCQALWCETVLVWFCPLHAVFSVVGLSACCPVGYIRCVITDLSTMYLELRGVYETVMLSAQWVACWLLGEWGGHRVCGLWNWWDWVDCVSVVIGWVRELPPCLTFWCNIQQQRLNLVQTCWTVTCGIVSTYPPSHFVLNLLPPKLGHNKWVTNQTTITLGNIQYTHH